METVQESFEELDHRAKAAVLVRSLRVPPSSNKNVNITTQTLNFSSVNCGILTFDSCQL